MAQPLSPNREHEAANRRMTVGILGEQKSRLSGRLSFAVKKTSLSAGVLQHSFFKLFLALDAMTRPRNSFQALGIDLFPARNALAEATVTDTIERAVNHLQELAIGIALMKQEFLVVRIGCPVSNVLSRFQVGIAAVLGGAGDRITQFPLAFLQPFLEPFQLLLVHGSCTLSRNAAINTSKKR